MRRVLIAGGGAAGMMAAIAAAEKGAGVTLLEKNEKLGKKLFITGKGRCNVTTACPPEDFLASVVTNPRFLYSAFSAFTNEDMIAFLKELGLPVKVERGQRVFPESDHSSDVIRALERECRRRGVEIRLHTRVEEVLLTADGSAFRGVRLIDGSTLSGDALILAMGGSAYPSTGSDGDGVRLAGSLGHTIRTPEPSLVPFTMREKWCRDLMGLSLKNVRMKVKCGRKTVYEGFGEFLFTHFGVSGPLVLTASAYLGGFQKELKEGGLTLLLDFKPALTPEQLEKRFLREFDTYRGKRLTHVMERLLPKRLVPVFLDVCGVDGSKRALDVSRKERRTLEETMKAFPMHIDGVRGFPEAIVTRGGVSVREVNPSTLESKRVKNVYLAGEMLDVDALTGGYNLQIAWSTGRAAGVHAAEADRILEK